MAGLKIILILILLAMGYQDLRERKIYLLLFPPAALAGIAVHAQTLGWYAIGIHASVNVVFLGCAMGILALYARSKKTVLLNRSMGSGDLALLVCLALSLPPLSFLALWLGGALLSLIVHGWLFPKPTIPFAGNLAILWALALVVDTIQNPAGLYLNTLP